MTGVPVNRSLVLTPPGPGAIGVVRVMGPDALSILDKVFRPKARGFQPGRPGGSGFARAEARGSFPEGDRVWYGRFVVDDEVVDEVLVSRAPTAGPPALDVSAHGGVRVIERILQALERHGAPLCEADEPPVPTWLTHNLIEQEATEALTRAKTERAVRFLAWQRQHLVPSLQCVASLCRADVDQAGGALEAMLAGSRAARTLIEGATLVILGPPNSGKSTLFNRLVGRPATIVSPRPGTTRDWVTAPAEMDGVPVTLVDTAGWMPPAAGPAIGGEQRAVDSGQATAAQADVCVLVLDGSQPLSKVAEVENLTGGLFNRASFQAALHPFVVRPSLPRWLTVMNKADLGCLEDRATLSLARAHHGDDPIRVSALTGSGIEELTERILDVLGYGEWVDACPCIFTSRQADVAAQAISDLREHPAAAEATIRERLIGA